MNKKANSYTWYLFSAFLSINTTTTIYAQSTNYPNKVVRIVNPVAAGGNQEMVARIYAEQFSKAFGQQFIVESRPGNSGIVGTRHVKNALADGYTLLAISNTFARTPVMVKDTGYDPIKDFNAISMTCDVPLVFVINPSLPAYNVKEFIKLAKQRPGEISSGSSGKGSTGHIAAELFAKQSGIRLLHIQYKGAAPAIIDLIGGHVMLRFDQISSSITHIKANKIRAIGVTSKKRSALIPNVPTIDESGLPRFEDTTFNGLMAPIGTPKFIIEKLHNEITKTSAINDLRNKYIDIGIELISSHSPEEFSNFLKKHVEEFNKLANAIGIIEK